MISSGMKRGLAASAVSALAVAGLPFLASSASAITMDDQVSGVTILSQGYTTHAAGATEGDNSKYKNTATDTNDGQNETISLVAAAPSTVTTVAFEYRIEGATDQSWKAINGVLARNADGVFATEWASPATAGQVVHLRAVPNTGILDATYDNFVVEVNDHAIELSTEGSLGIYQNPHTLKDNVAVRGTVGPFSDQTSVNVFDTIRDQVNAQNIPVEYDAATGVGSFAGVLQYDQTGANSYPYSTGTEANQVSLTAAIDETEDTEASTYYVQSISSVTATPKSTTTTSTTSATITVLDGQGKPVAGATVGYTKDTDTTDNVAAVDHPAQGTTDANGQYTFTGLGAGTYVLYADADKTAGHSAGDKDAAPFTITAYTAQLSTIKIVNERNRSNFDTDELSDGDDFTVETRDQQGNLYTDAGGVEYRWVIDAAGTANDKTTDWTKATLTADAGTYSVGAPPSVPGGSYTLEARRPNVAGTGLMNAAPVTVQAAESEITFDEGTDANAPIEGSYTVTGKLANANGALGGREVTINYGGTRIDSRLAPQADQPAGVTRTSDTTATVITGADGTFSVKLVDPAGPVVLDDVPENATLTATATAEEKGDSTSLVNSAYGENDGTTPARDASASITIHWAAQAEVSSIRIDLASIYGKAAPGRPVDLDVTVKGKDGDTNPDNDPTLKDYPVTVTVDKGFLSPNAETADDVTLADGHDATGDLWGFFKNLGQTQNVSTGDAGQAGVLAAIEKDAGFDDDGLVDMTITVKAGSVTETRKVTFDATNMLNQGASSLERAAGEPTGDVPVGHELKFQLYVHDQFGNLAGDQFARISDDSTVADFRTDEDFDQTLSDFSTSGPGVVAFSDAPAVQKLFAAMAPGEVLVDANDNPDYNDKNVTVASDPINWVAVPGPDAPRLNGRDNGPKDDHLKVNADASAAGKTAKLYKIKDGVRKVIAKATLNDKGDYRFTVADKNGNKRTKYIAKVGKVWTNGKSVR